jgi:hypothetical protein
VEELPYLCRRRPSSKSCLPEEIVMQEHLEATASKGTLLHSAIQGQGHNGLLNDSYNWVLGYPDYHVRQLVWSEDFDAPRSPASLATTSIKKME